MVALLFQLFGALSGVIEAVLYCRRGAEAFHRNEHIDMTLQRLVVAALAPAGALLYAWHGSVWGVVAELVPTALLFPLCHDEAYNFTRLWLKHTERYQGKSTRPSALNPDVAGRRAAWREYRYGYQSPTTTARNDFNGHQRTWLAIAGATLLCALYLYLHLTPCALPQ